MRAITIRGMKHILGDIITNSFVAIAMVVSGLGLYLTHINTIHGYSNILYCILAIGFLYWAIWFLNTLRIHITRLKDKKRSRAKKGKAKKRSGSGGNLILKPGTGTINTSPILKKEYWPFSRDWELIDKEILNSGCEQLGKLGGKIKADSGSKFFQKTIVYTFKCRLTGKVKIKVVRS